MYKNEIHDNIIPERREEFQQHLKNLRWNSDIRTIFDKASTLRGSELAHLSKDSSASEIVLDFRELWTMDENLHTLFNGILFGSTFPFQPTLFINTTHSSGIDAVIDAVVKNGKRIYLPETNPNEWALFQGLSADTLGYFNEHRRKLGLPEV